MKLKNLFPIIPAVIAAACAYPVHAASKADLIEKYCRAWGDIAYTMAKARDDGIPKFLAIAASEKSFSEMLFPNHVVELAIRTTSSLSINHVYGAGINDSPYTIKSYMRRTCMDGGYERIWGAINP